MNQHSEGFEMRYRLQGNHSFKFCIDQETFVVYQNFSSGLFPATCCFNISLPLKMHSFMPWCHGETLRVKIGDLFVGKFFSRSVLEVTSEFRWYLK